MLLLLLFARANSLTKELALGAKRLTPDRRASRLALLVACGWLAAGYSSYEVRGAKGAWWSSVARANAWRIVPAVAWVLRATPGDVIASEDEGAVYLYTGRRTVPAMAFTTAQYLNDLPAATNVAEGLQPILEAYPVTMVVVGTKKTIEAADFLVVARPPVLARGIGFPGGNVAYRVIGRQPR
jgi:hypothetical protein